ncbi:MAG: tetratricopeptide repeat protein [Candidatus Auribacterota bacterium]|jgi:tetratricopeptide (TPR) repeat protein|nr:tetratricopeptide repeat protein [Candidatus Auribacterota bacterium]
MTGYKTLCIALVIIFTATVLYSQDNDGSTQDDLANLTKQLDFYKQEGLKAIRKGEYPYAMNMFEKYIELDDSNFKIHEYLGQVYIHLQEYEKAMSVIERAVELNPAYVGGHMHLSKIYRDYGYEELSIEHLQEAMKHRKDVEIIYQLGITYERFNRLDKAQEAFEDVILLAPDHADAFFSLGLLHFRKKEFDQAIEKIRHALLISPDNFQYQTYLEKAQTASQTQPEMTGKDND